MHGPSEAHFRPPAADETHHIEIIPTETATGRIVPDVPITLEVIGAEGTVVQKMPLEFYYSTFYHYANNFTVPEAGTYTLRATLAWVAGRCQLHDVLRQAGNVHAPVWGGFGGLVLSGVLLEPDLTTALTQAKLGLVLLVGWNGPFVCGSTPNCVSTGARFASASRPSLHRCHRWVGGEPW